MRLIIATLLLLVSVQLSAQQQNYNRINKPGDTLVIYYPNGVLPIGTFDVILASEHGQQIMVSGQVGKAPAGSQTSFVGTAEMLMFKLPAKMPVAGEWQVWKVHGIKVGTMFKISF